MTDLNNAEQVYKLAMQSVSRRTSASNGLTAAKQTKTKTPPAYVRRRFPLIAATVLMVFVSLSVIVISSNLKTDEQADSIAAPNPPPVISEPSAAYSKAEDDIQALLIRFDSLNEKDKIVCAEEYRTEYERLRIQQQECCEAIRSSGGEEYTLLDARLDDQGVLKIELYSKFNTSLRLDSSCICYMSEGNVQIPCEQLIGGEISPFHGVVTLYVRPQETASELSGNIRIVFFGYGKYPDDLNGSLSFELSIDRQRRYLNMERYDRLIAELEEYI